MTVRLINPHEVSFGEADLPGCSEARLVVRPLRVRRNRNDGDRYESYVEVEGRRYVIEVDCQDVPAATSLTTGQEDSLSFAADKADGSGSVSVTAANAVLVRQQTHFRNEAKGLSMTTLEFECRSSSGSSVPVSIS